MPHLDIDAARRERNRDREPVTFGLGGETFTLLARIPLGETFDLIDAPDPPARDDHSEDARKALAESVRALTRFIDQVLIDEDRPRWAALLRRRDDPIDEWDVIDAGARIAEVYAARPTVPSSGSTGGRHLSGNASKPGGSAKQDRTSPT